MRRQRLHASLLISTAFVLLAGCHGGSSHHAGGTEGNGPVSLGRASSYAVLAGTRVDNTGTSDIIGDLGVSPGKTVTGFPTTRGTIDMGSLKSALAQEDLASAFDDADGRRAGAVGISGDLGGQTLTPGLYSSSSAISITGTLTLDAQGNPNALFLIQVPSSLTTGAGSQVALIGSADPFNVTWVVLGSADLGAGSTFEGSILAGQSITLGAGATIDGRALARGGSVTLDSNTVRAR